MSSAIELSDILGHMIREMEKAKKFGWSPIPVQTPVPNYFFVIENNKVIQYKLKKNHLHEYEAAKTIITAAVRDSQVMYRLEDNVSDDVLLDFAKQCKAATKFIIDVSTKNESSARHALDVLKALDDF